MTTSSRRARGDGCPEPVAAETLEDATLGRAIRPSSRRDSFKSWPERRRAGARACFPDGADARRLIHLPVHASWLNQIELYFSIVQRKALTPNDFDSLDQLAQRLLGFGEHYRQIAKPFNWTFTRSDLDRLLARIDTQKPQPALAA